MDPATGAIAGAVTAAFNTVSTAIQYQAAQLGNLFTVSGKQIDYNANIDYAVNQYALQQKKQQTTLIIILVVVVVVFLLIMLFRKK